MTDDFILEDALRRNLLVNQIQVHWTPLTPFSTPLSVSGCGAKICPILCCERIKGELRTPLVSDIGETEANTPVVVSGIRDCIFEIIIQ